MSPIPEPSAGSGTPACRRVRSTAAGLTPVSSSSDRKPASTGTGAVRMTPVSCRRSLRQRLQVVLVPEPLPLAPVPEVDLDEGRNGDRVERAPPLPDARAQLPGDSRQRDGAEPRATGSRAPFTPVVRQQLDGQGDPDRPHPLSRGDRPRTDCRLPVVVARSPESGPLAAHHQHPVADAAPARRSRPSELPSCSGSTFAASWP